MIARKHNPIMNRGLVSPEIAQRFYAGGLELSTSTPQGYHELIRSDLQAWRKLIKDSKISVESLP